MNSNTNSPKKMTTSQLEGWLAIRKKCAPQKSKKAYTRKEKHKQKFEKSQDIQYNIYRKSGEELQTLFLSFEDSSPTKFVIQPLTVPSPYEKQRGRNQQRRSISADIPSKFSGSGNPGEDNSNEQSQAWVAPRTNKARKGRILVSQKRKLLISRIWHRSPIGRRQMTQNHFSVSSNLTGATIK